MFRWTLTDNDLSVTENLEKDPRGWESIILKHERDKKWHGVSYDFTSELGFFCKGAGKELVDAAYENKGQEANVILTLDVKCNGNYTRLFTGRLNFSSYRQEWASGVLYSYLDVEKDDIKKLINSREEMAVDLLSNTSLSGTSLNSYPYLGYTINMHSKVIHIESEWESVTHGCCLNLITPGLKALNIVPNTNILQGDFKKSESTEPLCFGATPPIVNTTDNPIFKQAQTVTITWNITGTVTFTTYVVSPVTSVCDESECGEGALFDALFDSIDLKLRLYYGGGDTIEDATEGADCGSNPINQAGVKFIDLVTIPTFVSATNPDIKGFANTGNRDIILNPGDKIWYTWVVDFNLVEICDMVIQFDYTSSQLIIESDTVGSETTCTAIAIHEAWSRLSEIITDQKTAFFSSFFGRTDSNITYPSDGCGSKLAITSGKHIREIASTIPVSLKDLYDASNAIFGIGIGIEKYNGVDVIRAEPVHYFYQDTVVLTLENVPNIQMEHQPDLIYNQVKLGFKKWEVQEVNGLFEPNTRINYLIPPVKSSKNIYETMSPFVGAMYAIEFARREADLKTKDGKFDEDIFFICLNKDDLTIPEKNENFSSVTGLLSPETAYNLRLMPSVTFDRVRYLFSAGLTKLGTLANPIVMPAEGEGNETLTYAFIPDGCDGDRFGNSKTNGDDGIYPDSQARRNNPLWLPEIYSFDWPLSFEDYLTLITNPYGLIKFSDGQDNFYFGWLLTLEYNIRNKSGSFTLLRKYR